jgi:hypothetical protein
MPDPRPPDPRPAQIGPLSANLALTFLSAGLIGALFLVVIELINGWLVTPIGAAAVVTTIPLATAIAERAVRGVSPLVLGAAGSLLLGLGLLGLSRISHREPGAVVIALAFCGTGLGLGFPGLTAAALGGSGSATARAAKTVAARDAGLVLGLLLLTPVFVAQLNSITNQATSEAAGEVILAPLPLTIKAELAPGLAAAANSAPQSAPPDFAPVFTKISAGAPRNDRSQLAALQRRLDSIVQRSVTHAFKRPLLYAALLALLVLPLLGLRFATARLARDVKAR